MLMTTEVQVGFSFHEAVGSKRYLWRSLTLSPSWKRINGVDAIAFGTSEADRGSSQLGTLLLRMIDTTPR
jgi:hypothetical protein